MTLILTDCFLNLLWIHTLQNKELSVLQFPGRKDLLYDDKKIQMHIN